jgi:2-keto-3-deoxy-L-rhamnonate aldolase RhmA
MALKFMYITNKPEIALIAEKYGVERVWVDLETLGKEQRQHNMNTVKSAHTISDIKNIAAVLTKSDLLVRVNPFNPCSEDEINKVISAGAKIIMLPMWKSVGEVESFVKIVGRRAKTVLLLETKEAEMCLDEVLQIPYIDEVHIGLNDLHLSYGLTFMFELLANGTVERICHKLNSKGIPYGFGGVSKIGYGLLPAEKIIMEHYRLGSTRVILSRSFCNAEEIQDTKLIELIFKNNIAALRAYEEYSANADSKVLDENHNEIKKCVNGIVEAIGSNKKQ